MKLLDRIHAKRVFGRRVRVLTEHLCDRIPARTSVLDVGSGNGQLAARVAERRPDVDVRAVDVAVRGGTRFPIAPVDGRSLPYANASFDVVMFVDVLHHTDDPTALLREAKRVSRRWILLKDHTLDGPWAARTLRFMDRVGNERYGVALPYNYWPRRKWLETFADLELEVERWDDRLGIYPWPFSLAFDRLLHFVGLLRTG